MSFRRCSESESNVNPAFNVRGDWATLEHCSADVDTAGPPGSFEEFCNFPTCCWCSTVVLVVCVVLGRGHELSCMSTIVVEYKGDSLLWASACRWIKM
jgi:hypothetical protein